MYFDQEGWQLPRGQFEVLVVGRVEIHEGCQAVLCGVLDAGGFRQVPFINLHMQWIEIRLLPDQLGPNRRDLSRACARDSASPGACTSRYDEIWLYGVLKGKIRQSCLVSFRPLSNMHAGSEGIAARRRDVPRDLVKRKLSNDMETVTIADAP